MLQLETKWFTNTLAKKSMLNKDFILCHDGSRLFIVSYGEITKGGKNTYNYEIKDNEKNVVLSSGNNAYLDALTKIVLGSNPKSNANKESKANEATKETKQTNKKTKECLYLTFDEAFDKACEMLNKYYEIKYLFGKYSKNPTIDLTMYLQHEARQKERSRIKEAKKSEELKSLRKTLELAKAQNNTMLVDAINEMIANKEKE